MICTNADILQSELQKKKSWLVLRQTSLEPLLVESNRYRLDKYIAVAFNSYSILLTYHTLFVLFLKLDEICLLRAVVAVVVVLRVLCYVVVLFVHRV